LDGEETKSPVSKKKLGPKAEKGGTPKRGGRGKVRGKLKTKVEKERGGYSSAPGQKTKRAI